MSETIDITYMDIELEIEYTYTEAEPMVWRYADGDGYPGAPESAEIEEVNHNGSTILALLSTEDIAFLENKILEKR